MADTGKNPQLTEAQYAATGGVRCPFCGSGDLHTEARPKSGWGGTYWQGVDCAACGMAWADRYELTGFSKVE